MAVYSFAKEAPFVRHEQPGSDARVRPPVEIDRESKKAWSPRQTIAFVFLISAAFWLILAFVLGVL